MATRTTKASSGKASTKTAEKAKTDVVTENDTTKEVAPKRVIQNDTPVICKNGTRGNLIYKSSRNLGYEVEWNEFGEEQEISFGELLAMRGSQRRFFEENWILIEDPEVIKKLGVERYYKNIPSAENFDKIFSLSPEELKVKVSGMSDGMKDSVRIRAKELIDEGVIDSRATIKAISEAVGKDIEE